MSLTTNKQKRIEREEAILQTLKKLGLCTRSHLQKIHNLGSKRNASRVLKQMDYYLNSFMDTEQVYYLNKAGRNMVGTTKVITKNSQYLHTLMRNDIYIHFGCPKQWMNEFIIAFDKEKIVADAVFRSDNKDYILEVDNQQKMSANKDKLKRYFRFKRSELWQNSNSGHFPSLIYYTSSDYRKAQLQELNPGMDLIVYTKKDLP